MNSHEAHFPPNPHYEAMMQDHPQYWRCPEAVFIISLVQDNGAL